MPARGLAGLLPADMLGTRRCAALVTAVLALAAFNLIFRFGSESLTEWDSSLYANSAWEMVQSGNWIATTTDGVLDYYNSKPPLNVWLIALSLQAFGVSLMSIRVPSALAAWLTVLVLLVWAWRRFSPAVGLLSALVLTTCFGFFYVHSGRSANPDALLTLVLLLIVITLDSTREHPWRRAWLGPLLAAVFLLKGMAVLMPLLLIGAVEARRRVPARARWLPLAAAFATAALPVGVWALARWQVDGTRFFEHLFFTDFVALSTTSLDSQSGTPLFYLNILQKHHYDWLIAALTVVILFPPRPWQPVWRALRFWRGDDLTMLLGSWSAIALVVPTLMQTKMPWYLNPFYPMFALGVGWTLAYGFRRVGFPRHHRTLLAAMIAMAAVVAESRMIWYSYNYRALDRSVQGLLLVEADRIRGRRVFGMSWDHADYFVLRGLVDARRVYVMTIEEFLEMAGAQEFLVMPAKTSDPRLEQVRVYGMHALYRRAGSQ